MSPGCKVTRARVERQRPSREAWSSSSSRPQPRGHFDGRGNDINVYVLMLPIPHVTSRQNHHQAMILCFVKFSKIKEDPIHGPQQAQLGLHACAAQAHFSSIIVAVHYGSSLEVVHKDFRLYLMDSQKILNDNLDYLQNKLQLDRLIVMLIIVFGIHR